MRTCLMEPPVEADQAASLLDAAADAVLNEQMVKAADLLLQADIRTLHAYAAFVMLPTAELLGFKKHARQARHEVHLQHPGLRMPTGVDAEAIFKRDGFRCRYCSCRVVRPGVRSLLTALFPDIVRWPSGKGGDRAKHAAFYALNGVLDHVQPYARGGDSSTENIVTACWPCNFGKEDHTIEELCLSDPRLRTPVVDDWDGLARLVRNRRKPAGTVAKLQTFPQWSTRPDIEGWLTSMNSETSLGVIEALRDLLVSLRKISSVSLSIGQNLTVNIVCGGKSLGVLGLSLAGDVDVPWLISGEKDWFKPFAKSLADAVPEAVFYETPRMWRVDGCGTARGQITVDELVGAAAVVLAGVEQLAGKQTRPLGQP